MKKTIRRFFNMIKGICVITFLFFLFPIAKLFLSYKKIWIVSEYGYEARDNGYAFFKYMRIHHKEINCYYTISFSSPDYSKVEKYGNIIRFGSLKHYAYFCASKFIISSKTQGFCPSYFVSLLRKRFHLWGKYVFLQHGITLHDQKFLYKKPSKIDLFICGAKPEYDDISKRYGYKSKEVVYTGFARFDSYFGLKPKKQVLIMPTWRRYAENVVFSETEYYKKWMSFINSAFLNTLLSNSGVVVLFYIHPHFREQIKLFKSNCNNVSICSFEKLDLQTAIYDSSLLITDYSSLAFDFGYMRRPVIYYQFDRSNFYKGHYYKGYFDFDRDGFGPVSFEESELIFYLSRIIKSNFMYENNYLYNSERFFPLFDNNNSQRIFEKICMIKDTK